VNFREKRPAGRLDKAGGRKTQIIFRRKNMKQFVFFTALERVFFVLIAAVFAEALLLSCASSSYGVGGGYVSGTREIKSNSAGSIDTSNKNYSLYLAGINENSELSIAYHNGAVSAEAGSVQETHDIRGVSLGSYFKVPFVINQFFSPLLLFGLEYPWYTGTGAELLNEMGSDDFYLGNLAFKGGAGFDVSFSKSFYLRGRAYYAPALPMIINKFSEFSFSVGLGYRTDADDAKDKWKTADERTVEMVNKQGQEALDKKDYSRAIALYTRGIAIRENNYSYYYKRSEAHAGAGDYAAALDDFNRATRINPVLQGSEGYKTWKQLVADYEKNYRRDAPMDEQGKVIVRSSFLKISNPEDSSRWKGSGNGVSYPEDRYTFTFWYQEGTDKSREVTFDLQIEEGHVYYAEAEREGFSVTIGLADATERELRGGGKTIPIASKKAEIIVSPLPSGLALPSWVKIGLTERQVRNQMSSTPISTKDNVHIYRKGRESTMFAFTFSESGSGLIAYSAMIEGNRSTLNTVLSYFKKATGTDPITDSDEGKANYIWLVPSEIRGDILLLQVVAEDDTVFVKYAFLIKS
jgi:tetratricopeptide (TPR) repeat protein